MTHVVTENCKNCRFTECVEYCPVDCFYENPQSPEMIYIHPDECIDCGACLPECPVKAIYVDDRMPQELEKWLEINRDRSMATGAIKMTEKIDPLPGAQEKKKRLGF